MDEEKKTISERLDEIAEQLKEKKKEKKFKLPLGIRMRKGKPRKKNFVVVQSIKTNGAVDFKILPIEDDTVKIGEGIHDANAGHILRYKRYPLIIIPEWNMKPLSPKSVEIIEETTEKEKVFSPAEDFKEATENGTLTSAQKVILSKMKMEAIKPKISLNFKTILIILIIGGVLLYLLDYMKII